VLRRKRIEGGEVEAFPYLKDFDVLLRRTREDHLMHQQTKLFLQTCRTEKE